MAKFSVLKLFFQKSQFYDLSLETQILKSLKYPREFIFSKRSLYFAIKLVSIFQKLESIFHHFSNILVFINCFPLMIALY